MQDEKVNLLKGNAVNFKAHINYDDETYSLSVKTPVEALPPTNTQLVSWDTETAINQTQTTFLAVKNTSTEDINIRLVTFGIATKSNSDITILIKDYDVSEVTTGTFTPYEGGKISEYSTDVTGITIPNNSADVFGAVVKAGTSFRLNLVKDDVILRILPNKVAVFNGIAPSANNNIAYFLRFVEEF